jgi:DNA-binding FadR family transcriptional regulator
LLLWSGREETTLTEHAAIVGFLKSNDDVGAAQAMEDHLNRAKSSFSSAPKP